MDRFELHRESALMKTLDGVNSELRERVELMLAECPLLWVSSAFRPRKEQERLYQLFLDGKGSPANKPGTSKHEIGLAVDIGCEWTENVQRAELGKKYGLCAPIKKEPWHFELDPKRKPLPPKPTPQPKKNEDDDMYPRFAACSRKPSPARWVLTPDGGVRAEGGAEFYGSVLDLPKEHRPDQVFDIDELPDRDGYMVCGILDGVPDWYGAFDAAEWSRLQALRKR